MLERQLGDLLGPRLLDRVEDAVAAGLSELGHAAFDYVAGLIYQPEAPALDARPATVYAQLRWAFLRAAAGTSRLTDLDLAAGAPEVARAVVSDLARYEVLDLDQLKAVLETLDLPAGWLTEAAEVLGAGPPGPVVLMNAGAGAGPGPAPEAGSSAAVGFRGA